MSTGAERTGLFWISGRYGHASVLAIAAVQANTRRWFQALPVMEWQAGRRTAIHHQGRVRSAAMAVHFHVLEERLIRPLLAAGLLYYP